MEPIHAVVDFSRVGEHTANGRLTAYKRGQTKAISEYYDNMIGGLATSEEAKSE